MPGKLTKRQKGPQKDLDHQRYYDAAEAVKMIKSAAPQSSMKPSKWP